MEGINENDRATSLGSAPILLKMSWFKEKQQIQPILYWQPLKGCWKKVQTKIRCHIMWHLIWVPTILLLVQAFSNKNIFYSILFYPITLEGRRGTTDEFATIPFHLDLFSAALVEVAKSIPVHSLILSSHLFFCLPLFLFPFTVP